MADSIIFLKEGGEGYYEEKKSRFLAACYRIESEVMGVARLVKSVVYFVGEFCIIQICFVCPSY